MGVEGSINLLVSSNTKRKTTPTKCTTRKSRVHAGKHEPVELP